MNAPVPVWHSNWSNWGIAMYLYLRGGGTNGIKRAFRWRQNNHSASKFPVLGDAGHFSTTPPNVLVHKYIMLLKLFLAFTLVPVAEIYLLIKVGNHMGALNTVALVIATGIAGAYLARLQGMQTMFRVRANLEQGVMPAEAMLDALLIFVAGVVLLTPGFITDALGLLLLIPETRFHFKRYLRRKFDHWIQEQDVHINRIP